MRKLVVLSILVMVLGCASWAGAWSYDTVSWSNSTGPVLSGATVDMDFYFGESDNHATYQYGDTSALGLTVTVADGDPASKSVNNQVYLGLTPFSGGQLIYGTLVTLYDDNSGSFSGGAAGDAPGDYTYLVFFGNDFAKWNGDETTPDPFSSWTGEFDKYPSSGPDKTGISVCVVGVEAAPVPIPGAVWLLGSGLGSLIVARRRRKSKA